MFLRSWFSGPVGTTSRRSALPWRSAILALATLLVPLSGSGLAGSIMTFSLDTPYQTVPQGTPSVWFSGTINVTIAPTGGGAPILFAENAYIDDSFDHTLFVGSSAPEYLAWLANNPFNPNDTVQYVGRLFELVIGAGDPPGLYNHSSVSIGDVTDAFVYESTDFLNKSTRVVYAVMITPSAVPEIDPAAAGVVAAFVGGLLGLCERRRRLAPA